MSTTIPAIEATHLASQMALYANLWSGKDISVGDDAQLFERLYLYADLPMFFDLKKSKELGWVQVERLLHEDALGGK